MFVKALIEKYQDYAIQMRREFHQHPESSMQEFRTQKRIMEELYAMGIEHYAAGGTGVVGLIHGISPGRTVALRADMDALELQEENEVPYKSQNQGLMHACGHDGHTASLLAAAKILKDLSDTFNGTVKLLFQPGEETGKGGHGSMPQQSEDAAVVGASILLNLQSIVSREINPLEVAVISVGIIKSGTRFNIIAGAAYLEGTTRCFSHEINVAFEEQIRRVAENTAKVYRATARVEYQNVVIPTINDLELSIMANQTVESLFGSDALLSVPQSTGGEDFSYYSKNAPSMFALVGTQNIHKLECFPHHHSKFDIDEDALAIATGLYAQFAIDFLKQSTLKPLSRSLATCSTVNFGTKIGTWSAF